VFHRAAVSEENFIPQNVEKGGLRLGERVDPWGSSKIRLAGLQVESCKEPFRNFHTTTRKEEKDDAKEVTLCKHRKKA